MIHITVACALSCDRIPHLQCSTLTQLCDAGISVNMPAKFSKNKPMNTDIINKVCEYLCVQPSEIIEWIPDAEYNKTNAEIASIDQQIAELEAKKKQLQGK